MLRSELMAGSPTAASRVHAVVTQLRQGIFEGRFPPGSPLRELTLARDLSVSQATVREALQQLEHSGLVVRKLNVGSMVTRLSPKDIRDRVEIRAMLEVKAARGAAARMGETEFTELERRLQALESAVASNSYYESAQADLGFHRYIWVCSGSEILRRLLEQVTIPLFAFISILRSQGLQRLVTVVADHQPLVAALRSRDAVQIQAAFEEGATSAYRVFIEEGPERELVSAFGFLEFSPN
jgi:DNA-binding GntR family transcriptional regulator